MPGDIPAGVQIMVRPFIPKGQIVIMVDFNHPEASMTNFGFDFATGGVTAEPAEIPDGRIICCHPDDEGRVRDALAVAQEKPKWWLDWQSFEKTMRVLGGG